MKTTREWKQVTITKKGTKKLQSGHPWVYEGEVLALEANIYFWSEADNPS